MIMRAVITYEMPLVKLRYSIKTNLICLVVSCSYIRRYSPCLFITRRILNSSSGALKSILTPALGTRVYKSYLHEPLSKLLVSP